VGRLGLRNATIKQQKAAAAAALTERVLRAMEGTTLDLLRVDEKNGRDGGGDGGGRRRKGGSRGGKPNCVILNKIDGADAKSSIAALVDIARAVVPPPAGSLSSSRGKRGRGGTATTPHLRRPIIVICNHKYAPALRPILPYALQFDVHPPDAERLAGRLRAVLSAERMSIVAGRTLLRRPVSGTGGDVCSCLYALQFASACAREVAIRKREREGGGTMMVDISLTLMAALGNNGSNDMKDMQSDVSSTVATVIRRGKVRTTRDINDRNNKRRKTSDGSPGKFASTPRGVDVVLRAVDHVGDNSKTLNCLWMNVNRSDARQVLRRPRVAIGGGHVPLLQVLAMNNGAKHQLMQKYHIPTTAAAVHLLCSVETRPDLTFSTRPLSDCHYQNQANVLLIHRFMEGLPPLVRMSDCCLQGIQPCKCKREGHQWVGNQVLDD